MGIQIHTSNHSVNRFSDFRLDFSLTKGGVAYVPTAFVMAFYVDQWDCDEHYIAKCVDGEYTNCAVNGSTISVFFNSPGFSLGMLKCRVLDAVDDSDFSDGTLDTCTPIDLPVEIVAGAGDTDAVVLDYGTAYFGDDHDLILEGPASPSFGKDNDLLI
jgi:hypothetical protein